MSKRSEADFINFMNDLYYQTVDDMNTLQKIYDYKTKYNNTEDELLKWLNNEMKRKKQKKIIEILNQLLVY